MTAADTGTGGTGELRVVIAGAGFAGLTALADLAGPGLA